MATCLESSQGYNIGPKLVNDGHINNMYFEFLSLFCAVAGRQADKY